MTTRDLDNHPMAYSRLAGREVSTWSEEWKHECEIAYLARLSPEKLRRCSTACRAPKTKATANLPDW